MPTTKLPYATLGQAISAQAFNSVIDRVNADEWWPLSFNTRTGHITLTKADVTTALSYIPEDSANTVNTFNNRKGAVTLTSTDVTNALGYIPSDKNVSVNSFNSRFGAVTLNRTDVVNALGITPADSLNVVNTFNNRKGAVTLTAADITTALGFQPHSEIHPAGNTVGSMVVAGLPSNGNDVSGVAVVGSNYGTVGGKIRVGGGNDLYPGFTCSGTWRCLSWSTTGSTSSYNWWDWWWWWGWNYYTYYSYSGLFQRIA